MRRSPIGLFGRLRRLLYARNGPLTRELRLAPRFRAGACSRQARRPNATTTMICGFCSTGCALERSSAGRRGRRSHADRRVLRSIWAWRVPKDGKRWRCLDAPDRATTPLVADRRGRAGTGRLGHGTADVCAARMRRFRREYGPHSVAFLGTGQIADRRVGAARVAGQVRHGDDARRRQHAAVHGDVPSSPTRNHSASTRRPTLMPIFEESDVIVLVGANVCIAHPILWQRVMRNPHRPEIIVVDPRRTETAMQATLHIPLRPKSDLELVLRLGPHLDRERLDRPAVYRCPHQQLRRIRGVRRAVLAGAGCRSDGNQQRSSAATWPSESIRASEFRFGGRWESTKATKACEPRRA